MLGPLRSGRVRTLRQAICRGGAGRWRVRGGARGARGPVRQPDLVDMVPPDGAAGVPPNATLAAHYTAAAEYLGEEVVLVRPDGERAGVAGDVGTRPSSCCRRRRRSRWSPGTIYEVRWPALRGLNAAAPGVGDTRALHDRDGIRRRSRPRSRAWPACRGISSA